MLDKEAIEAIEAITEAGAITAAAAAIAHEDNTAGIVALPEHFKVHDLEQYLPARRRFRGNMRTADIASFADYVARRADTGCSVFIAAPPAMKAVAVMNMGSIVSGAGHCDDTATLAAEQTAAYAALLKATSQVLTQRDLAEFLEDWERHILCYASGDVQIMAKLAVDAVRRLTIEEQRRVESTEASLSASRSTFEAVKASGAGNNLPEHITFAAVPYLGLGDRVFGARVAVLTDGKAPMFRLRIIWAEKHAEEMAREFAGAVSAQLSSQIDTEKVRVYLGCFASS